jgi:uncharacterized protein YbjT (DUF2867 family)
VARFLIIGCGCRGRSLARELRSSGHAVRGTTRDPDTAREIEAAGAQAHLGDPDRVATIAPAMDHVSLALILLGSAQGSPEHLEALHGSRLEMLLTKMLDTTVRGIVYESAGTVAPEILRAGADRVRAACEDSRIPFEFLAADPAEPAAWVAQAAVAVGRVLLA